jgi:transposase-like protein
MRVHSNSTTNQNQRILIRRSKMSCADLARQLQVSRTTVHRWKQRDTPVERSCRPNNIRYALSPEEEVIALALREQDLPLDEVTDAIRSVLPLASRASIHRLFVRKGVNRLPTKEQQSTGHPGVFKEYGPGYLHIDCFYLPKLEGVKRYCFVAIDRATRTALLEVYEHKDKAAATDFLTRCLKFYPFTVQKVLTDNGREYTLDGFKSRYGPVTTIHPFGQLCRQEGIEHRLTKPYTPKTNGLVERMNGLTKENTTRKHTYQTADEMRSDIRGWFERYNFHRKNRRIGGKTPYEATCEWYRKEPEIFRKPPESLLLYRSQCCET